MPRARLLHVAAWAVAGVIGVAAVAGVAEAVGHSDRAGGAHLTSASGSPSATPSGTPSASAAPGDRRKGPREGRPGKRDRGALRRRDGAPGAGRFGRHVLHGEFVVRDKEGRVRTLYEQQGVVTVASAVSLTVKSTDGYTRSYALGAGTRVRRGRERAKPADLRAGDTVLVVGTVTDPAYTARLVVVRKAR